jgi:hypothetical protein
LGDFFTKSFWAIFSQNHLVTLVSRTRLKLQPRMKKAIFR